MQSSKNRSHFENDIQGRQSLTGVITKSISMGVLLYQLFTRFRVLMWKWLSYKTFVTRIIIFNWNVNLLTVPNYELIYTIFSESICLIFLLAQFNHIFQKWSISLLFFGWIALAIPVYRLAMSVCRSVCQHFG